MSKDPAFLFYSSDFLTGTMFMTDEQVGRYIRLLCAQHQTGPLTEKDMIFICKSYDELVWSKFIKDADGRYYNKRLMEESEKRKNFCQSRSLNKKGKVKSDHKNGICKSYDVHMENENENRNIDIVIKEEDSKEEKPTIQLRADKFAQEAMSVNDCLNESDLKDFVEYWTAYNDGDRKMNFEKQRNFYMKLRIKTWYRNTLKTQLKLTPKKTDREAEAEYIRRHTV